MKKLWKELKFCWDQIRCKYPRQQEIKDYDGLVGPMMSLELKPYTFIECITTAYTCGVPLQRVTDVGLSLYVRSNRGNVDMKEIRNILTRNNGPGRFRHAR